MTLLTKSHALNLSAPLRYAKTRAEQPEYTVWVEGQEHTGPHAIVTRNPNGTWKGRRIYCASVGTSYSKWLGGFRSRKIAAHAALCI